MRRSRRDVRDRKAFLLATVWLLFVATYYGGYLWNLRQAFDAGTRMIFSIFGAILFFTVAGRWFFLRREEQANRRDSDAAVNSSLRSQLANDGFALSVLLGRYGSEQFLREKHLPSGIEITTRQAHLAKLRSLDLWSTLPPAVRDLLLMPDGHWPENALPLWQAHETLRCLRWVMRVDKELVPLTHLPRIDFQSVQQLVEHPHLLLNASGMQDIWDIRVQRVQAGEFFSRCYAEILGRGSIPGQDPDTEAWAKTVFAEARQPFHRDILVQHYTVAELDGPLLHYVSSTAWHRFQSLQLIMTLLDTPDDPAIRSEWAAQCFPITTSHLADDGNPLSRP